jgi:Janus/Ocnus family (Ocnus)
MYLRGEKLNFHKDILEKFIQKELDGDTIRFDVRCKGGGRIRIEDKELMIYSYSQAFGRGDHKKAA